MGKGTLKRILGSLGKLDRDFGDRRHSILNLQKYSYRLLSIIDRRETEKNQEKSRPRIGSLDLQFYAWMEYELN